jgi:hypothetical protein
MGQSTRGVHPGNQGAWQVDKWWGTTRLRKRGFGSFEEVERRLEEQRAGERCEDSRKTHAGSRSGMAAFAPVKTV